MGVKSDIEIAQEAEMLDIVKVAAKAGVKEDELELYGKYKAKLSDELYERLADKEDGKLILVTAINPTPAGEGKTTISIGLTEGLWRIRTGGSYGRFKSSFYRRFSCDNIRKQFIGGNA